MRLTTAVWTSALVRRLFGDGDYAVIERRGAGEAGAVFVRVRHRNGTATLFAPAPQAIFDEKKPQDRVFERRLMSVANEDVDALLERETRFDPDLWIVELETERPEDYLEIMPD